ncbi:MAG: hypothetical protein LZF62_480326 [Nitrospira sp.]|nr:MAG: hypothetical protein LZF62_480326 [Nitrospira sp.]
MGATSGELTFTHDRVSLTGVLTVDSREYHHAKVRGMGPSHWDSRSARRSVYAIPKQIR